MKQFKPAVLLIIVLAVVVIAWTLHRDVLPRDGAAEMLQQGAMMSAATAPAIMPGTPAPHADWGPCTNCHTMIGAAKPKNAGSVIQVATAPPISPNATAPHPDWGKCSNCHDIVGAGAARPAAATVPVATVVPPIGIWLRALTPATADRLGLDNADGALVTGVHASSPAGRAGLKVGDVIRRIDNSQIETLNDALVLIGNKGPESTLKMMVWRDGKERKIYVKLPQARTPQAQQGAQA